MSAASAGNLMVLQGGGPTPVLNASLFGVLDEARRQRDVRRIFGARMGVTGLLDDDVVELSFVPQRELESLKVTPGASLGSSRQRLTDADVEQIIERLRERDIRYLLFIGGNGSMRAADQIAQRVESSGHDLCVIGVPKTIDNDIEATDRCPGFASAARYVAQSVRDLGMDVRALPQPVSIYETMGRSVGWLAGASVLAKIDEGHAPHLIYLPERPFEIERFVGDVDRVVTRRGWAVVVVTEGLLDGLGRPVYEIPSATQRDALDRPLSGGVGAHLADVISQRLGIRCRSEKPGLCGRASALHVSAIDRADAEQVGREGVRAAIAGHRGKMVSLRPLRLLDARGTAPCELVPLAKVTGGDRAVPSHWLDNSDTSVSADFIEYVRPLVGRLAEYAVPLIDQLTSRKLQRQFA